MILVLLAILLEKVVSSINSVTYNVAKYLAMVLKDRTAYKEL